MFLFFELPGGGAAGSTNDDEDTCVAVDSAVNDVVLLVAADDDDDDDDDDDESLDALLDAVLVAVGCNGRMATARIGAPRPAPGLTAGACSINDE